MTDEKYMKLCFDLAKKGAGHVSPNPLVGAVIVNKDKIVSTGFHSHYGGHHAEINAISAAIGKLGGSTLYCNLEPCAHDDKQTPPCVPKIILSGIKKVVISNIDTNPKVKGKGIQKLREHGIEVETGILREEGEELNRFFFNYIKKAQPYITMKIAISSDGKISKSLKEQTWLTGIESQKFVHEMRSVYDAVMVGAKTVNVDNPELTVRSIEGRNSKRIIIDGELNSRLDAKVFNDGKSPTIIVCSNKHSEEKKQKYLKHGVELIELNSEANKEISFKLILAKLAELKISSILVEGGHQIFSQFILHGLADEIIYLTAPIVLGKGIELDLLDSPNYFLLKKEMIGNDLLSIYRKRNDNVYRHN